jgi:hypothetical protein
VFFPAALTLVSDLAVVVACSALKSFCKILEGDSSCSHNSTISS